MFARLQNKWDILGPVTLVGLGRLCWDATSLAARGYFHVVDGLGLPIKVRLAAWNWFNGGPYPFLRAPLGWTRTGRAIDAAREGSSSTALGYFDPLFCQYVTFC